MYTVQIFIKCFAFMFLIQNDAPPQTVAYVDLVRYMGKWYEIARYTKWFEKDMTHVTAEYIYDRNQPYVTVINSGIKHGKKKTAKGKAFVVEGSNNAKLLVQFFWPFKGDYWIIDLDQDYQWAIVSDRNRSTLWILSRTAQMDEALYYRLLKSLEAKGFHLDKLERTSQD